MGCNMQRERQSENQNSNEGWLWKNISCQHALKNKTGSLGLSPGVNSSSPNCIATLQNL